MNSDGAVHAHKVVVGDHGRRRTALLGVLAKRDPLTGRLLDSCAVVAEGGALLQVAAGLSIDLHEAVFSSVNGVLRAAAAACSPTSGAYSTCAICHTRAMSFASPSPSPGPVKKVQVQQGQQLAQ
eukprot:jgi/Mesen1/7513/ME000039S06735